MKNLMPTLCVVAVAGIGIGAWGSSYLPYVSRFAGQYVLNAGGGNLPADQV